MTNEQLLIPRIKVISPYPFSPYEVGDVIEMGTDDLIEGEFFAIIKVKIESTKHFSDEIVKFSSFDGAIKAFPKLFKPLKWWEERNAADMPEFIKGGDGIIYKVKDWAFEQQYGSVTFYCYNYRANRGRGSGYTFLNNNTMLHENMQPATEAEYNNYLKTLYP